MPTYWTDECKENQQPDRPGRSLLTWIQTLIRIRNNNQQQRRKDNAKN